MAVGPNQIASFMGTSGFASQTLYLNLFTDNETIGAGTVAGSLTVATGGGYAEKTLAGTSWTGTSVGGTCTITAPQQTFTFTGTVGNVYGWALTTGSALTGSLVLAQKFPIEQMIGNNQDSIIMTPTFVREATIVEGEPPSSYLINQNFETPTTGYDNGESWTETGTIEAAYATAPLRGTQSLYLDSAAADGYSTFTLASDKSELWGHALFRWSGSSTLIETVIIAKLFDSTPTQVGVIAVQSDTNLLRTYNPEADDAYTVDPVNPDTTYHIWWHWAKGSGNATIEVWFGTTTTRPASSGNKYAISNNGTVTTDAHFVQILGVAATQSRTFKMDQVIVSDSEFTTVDP